MKTKLLFVILLVHFTALGQITSTGGYCPAEFDGGSFPKSHCISSFSFGNFTNVSGPVQQPLPHYIFYNNLYPGPYMQGWDYPVSIDVDSVGNKHLDIYIECNKDGFFDPVTERFLSVPVMAGTTNITGTISIPFSSHIGMIRLRLILSEDSGYTWAPSCFTQLDWGETEDYEIQVGITASVNENSMDNFLIYPNPASDRINVESEMQLERIELFDLSAKKVLAIDNHFSGSLDISLLESGTYVLRAISTSGDEVRKLILKN